MLGYHSSSTSLIKLVPARHFYQQLLKEVDFSFIRPLFEPSYSVTGRPSIDPVVFVKLLLVSHFENISSDRKLLELAALHLGIRSFLGYSLEQPLPWHSTISRTRKRIPVSVFETAPAARLFQPCRRLVHSERISEWAYSSDRFSLHQSQRVHESAQA